MSDMKIVTHEDGSITITETTLEGKRLSVKYPPEAAHDELVRRGAKCPNHKRVKTTETEFRIVEFDELSDEAKSEVAEHASLTDTQPDRALLSEWRDEWNALYEARVVAMSDMADLDERNGKLDRIEQRLRELRDEMAVIEACVAIAELDTTEEG
jgi:hypothetical protein